MSIERTKLKSDFQMIINKLNYFCNEFWRAFKNQTISFLLENEQTEHFVCCTDLRQSFAKSNMHLCIVRK